MIKTVKRLNSYLKERFPWFSLSIYSLLTIFAINSAFKSFNIFKVFGLALLYVLFLFHLRVLDEFKDFQYDAENHADRPIPRGLIDLNFIKTLGIINFALQVTLSYLLAPPAVFLLYLLTLTYTGLMFKEFFASRFLRVKPVLYLISHEIVLIPLFLFFYSTLNGALWKITSFSKLALFIYTFLPIILIEIGRKLKHRVNTEGKHTNDTYAYVWGEKTSIVVFAAIIILAGILSFSRLLLLSGAILILGSQMFPKFIVKNHMGLTTIFALLLPILLIL